VRVGLNFELGGGGAGEAAATAGAWTVEGSRGRVGFSRAVGAPLLASVTGSSAARLGAAAGCGLAFPRKERGRRKAMRPEKAR